MTKNDKTIENKDLEGVSGGRSYWDGPVVRFSSDDGDWHKGDRFLYNSPNSHDWEYIELIDNGVFIDKYTGHRYNGKRYKRSNDEFRGNVTITDYDVMMKKWDLEFLPR